MAVAARRTLAGLSSRQTTNPNNGAVSEVWFPAVFLIISAVVGIIFGYYFFKARRRHEAKQAHNSLPKLTAVGPLPSPRPPPLHPPRPPPAYIPSMARTPSPQRSQQNSSTNEKQ